MNSRPPKNDWLRAVRTRTSIAETSGGAWTTRPDGQPVGKGVEVLREERTEGWKPVKVTVTWVRPSDGEKLYLEVDIMGVIDPTTGRIPDALIHTLLMICPKCGPDAPQGSPKGQIHLRGYDVKPHVDQEGRLSIEEPIKCPWLCGWRVQVREGVAYSLPGKLFFWG